MVEACIMKYARYPVCTMYAVLACGGHGTFSTTNMLTYGMVFCASLRLSWSSAELLSAPACAGLSAAGVFAVMSFLQSICWMNIAASSLVHVFVLLGVIVGVKPALLGATVLAYGNSVPDLMNNLALTQDGFPSMAVAACFAGPLFTLLVGIGSAMAYGAVLNHGVLHVPVDGPMLIMIGFGVVNLVKYLLLVPLLYGFRMDRKLAFTAFLYYACFNVVYGLAIAGVITIPVPKL